nr:uncharacterized protein LOC129384642 [Dermacentor andersoni]
MTEQRSGGHTPPAFAFIEEATPGTSREGGEGASGTCVDYPAYIDEYINDALKALNRQTDASDVNDATDSGSTNYAPVVSTASANHAWPRTSHAGIEKLSSTTKDTASCSDDAWRCQRNAQHRPIADQTYSLDGAYSSGSPSHLHLGPISSIDHKKPSISHAGMVEASASLQYGARNPPTTWVHQSNTQYYTTARTSTIQGYAHNRDTGSTSFTLPVYSSSGGGKYAVASTSHVGTEEASGILGNDARIPDATGAEPWSTQYYVACGTTTVSGQGASAAASDAGWEVLGPSSLFSQLDKPKLDFRVRAAQQGLPGHTHVTESGITSSLPMVSSSSVNHAQPSTSRAAMEEATAVPENIAWNAPGTGGTEQREMCGVCGTVSNIPDALHGHAKEQTEVTSQISFAQLGKMFP